jgi:acyl-CoA synthetase (NDP forming)
MLASAPPEHYEQAMRLLLADESVDSLVTIFIPPLVTNPNAVAAAIVRGASGSRKPVLATFMSAHGAPPELQAIPSYMFPEAAATALARVVAHGEWRARPRGTVPAMAGLDAEAARKVIEGADGWLPPADVHAVLRAFGITVAGSIAASTEDEAVAAAQRVGGAVAMKAVGPSIVHKTEVGGVVLNLQGDEAVRRAYREMAGRLGAAMSGVVVQAMVSGGVEMLVGATSDPSFGPVIACGSGGTLVELFADVSVRLHPLTDVDAADMIEGLRAAPLLRGYRGAPPLDEAALRDVLLRVSALVGACPEVLELDINPLKVLPSGTCAVDARMRVGHIQRMSSRRVVY